LRGKTRLSDLSDSGVVTEWSTDDRCDDGVGRSSGDFEVVGRSSGDFEVVGRSLAA
jgi:hypothetical protein